MRGADEVGTDSVDSASPRAREHRAQSTPSLPMVIVDMLYTIACDNKMSCDRRKIG